LKSFVGDLKDFGIQSMGDNCERFSVEAWHDFILLFYLNFLLFALLLDICWDLLFYLYVNFLLKCYPKPLVLHPKKFFIVIILFFNSFFVKSWVHIVFWLSLFLRSYNYFIYLYSYFLFFYHNLVFPLNLCSFPYH
jgi:hypothetical protein